MILQDRRYQNDLRGSVHQEWNQGAQNVVMRLDTGGGKTKILSDEIHEEQGAVCALAHRNELVGQLSQSLARYGVRHDIVASDATCRDIARAHVEEHGTCFYTPGSRVKVVSVDTLVRRDGLENWASQVKLFIPDEAHHVLRDNKWGAAEAMFTNPAKRGLFPTATPVRADRKGLGRHHDGLADTMVEGPPMRWLIDQGYLTDYDIVCPTSDMHVMGEAGASGDWSTKQLAEAAKNSHIVGDVVAKYQQFAPGRLGITFCTDVETAIATAAAFNLAGVPAEVLTGKTDGGARRHILKRYRTRQILQLVTVDIVSEGFDLPAIEVASMARPTQSLALYMQQFGRALRTMEGKSRALIIDHVSNLLRHQGPPDKPRIWTLDRGDKRASTKNDDAEPIRVCANPYIECVRPYSALLRACPHCGYAPPPRGRSTPQQVDGDMGLLDPDVLAALRGAIAEADMSVSDFAQGQVDKFSRPTWIKRHVDGHVNRQAAQTMLRAAMGRLGAIRRAQGWTDVMMQRSFFAQFGVDVLSAQALGAADAWNLLERVDGAVNRA